MVKPFDPDELLARIEGVAASFCGVSAADLNRIARCRLGDGR
ncbi:MAG: hypothetical protein ACLT98_04680 [Eggerthellaceae bacterium]